MRPDYPLTIFYDASCPVCALEMDQLQSRGTAGRLVLVDMSAPGFDAAHYGLNLTEIDAVIHALRPDGSVVRGMGVLRLAYAAAGLGWVLRPTATAPLKPVFDAAYRVFARHRKPISRALAPLIDALRERRTRRVLADMDRCVGTACPASGATAGAVHGEPKS
jgi:predicted DCC family thiol-disulfide oxidoreductase YuxK